MDYSKFGIPWNDCRKLLPAADMARLEKFVGLNENCCGSKERWWFVEDHNPITDVFLVDFIGNADDLCNRLLQIRTPIINLRVNTTGGQATEMLKIFGTMYQMMLQGKTIYSVVGCCRPSSAYV